MRTWHLLAVVSVSLLLRTPAVRANTYFLSSQTNSYSLGAPYPFDPYDGAEPTSLVGNASNHIYLVHDNPDDFALLTTALVLDRQMNTPDGPPGPGEGDGGGTNDLGGSSSFYSFDTNSLWLEITNVSSGFAHLNIHNATNNVYEIWSRTDLLQTNWNIELDLWPTNGEVMPFTLPVLDRTNALFISGRDWTGITSLGNTVPEWWLWHYLGTVDIADTNLDTDGHSFAYEYANGLTPTNYIQFSVSVTNNLVNTSLVPVQIQVDAGIPSFLSIVDSTNFTAQGVAWRRLASSNLLVDLNSAQGEHQIWVGLRGFPTNAVATWHEVTVTLDTQAPSIIVTNPTSGTVSQSYLQAQGAISEQVNSLKFSISNAAGIKTNLTGYITGQFYDTNIFAFTTNYFQLYDIPLTNGVNSITIFATDRAGNTGTTNLAVTLDYSSDAVAPGLQLTWPQNGTKIAGDTFALQAVTDDPLANVTGSIVDSAGHTNAIPTTVYRSGKVSAKNVPLASGTNTVHLVAMDAAGNSVSTNFTVIRSSAVTIAAGPVLAGQQNQTLIIVSGTVSDTSYSVHANGIVATNDSSGHWTAHDVPVSSTGTAIVNVEIYDSNGNPIGSQVLSEIQPAAVKTESYDYKEIWIKNARGVDYYTLVDTNWVLVPQDCWHLMHSLWSTEWSLNSDEINHDEDDAWDYRCADPVLPESHTSTNPEDNREYLEWNSYWYNGEIYRDYLYGDEPSTTYYAEKSKVVVDDGDGEIGTTKTYLIRASALGWDEFTGFTIPIPPETLQINGEPLINTGSNDDSQIYDAVLGETLVQAPAGTRPDITPIATQFTGDHYYSFNEEVIEVKLQAAVDANRDGQITFDAANQTAADKPYRFWVNDDEDVDDGDVLPATSRDCDDFVIIGRRDLEDMSRLHLSVEGFTSELTNGIYLVGLKWKTTSGTPAINIFSAVETNGGTMYLTDLSVAAQQAPAMTLRTTVADNSGHLRRVDTSGAFLFPPSFWSGSATEKKYLLFEGCSAGKGQLVMTINKPDGTELAECGGVWLELLDIKSMYQRASATPSDSAFAPPYNQGSSSLYTNQVFDESNLGYALDTTVAFQQPPDETKQCVVFVHGWNMDYDEYLSFSETMFKRLWWQGYKGRFCSFRWATLTSPFSYNTSEFRAWKYGLSLKQYVESLKSNLSGYSVNIVAHSMGNIVTGSALNRGLTIDNYVLLQAAVPAGCYDTSGSVNSYSPFATAESSHPTPDSAIPDMGYRGYFTNVSGNLVNFYNPNDFALATGNLSTLTHVPFLWWIAANWEGNQKDYKPDIFSETLYGYDSTQQTLQKGQFLIRHTGPSYTVDHYVTDPQEMMSFIARPRSQAVGASADVGGVLNTAAQVDLNARFGFDIARDEHSAQFNWNIQRVGGTSGFYQTLLTKLFPPD